MSRYRKHFAHVEERVDLELLTDLQKKLDIAIAGYKECVTPEEAGKRAEQVIVNAERLTDLIRGTLESEIVDYSPKNEKIRIIYDSLPVNISYDNKILNVKTQLTTNLNGSERQFLCRKIEAAIYRFEKENGMDFFKNEMSFPLAVIQIRNVTRITSRLRDSDNESVVVMNCLTSSLGFTDSPKLIPLFTMGTRLVDSPEKVCSEFLVFSHDRMDKYHQICDKIAGNMANY